MKKENKTILFVFLLAFSLLLTACAQEKVDSTGNIKNQEGKKENGTQKDASNELIFALLSDAVSLDPHKANDVPSANMTFNIYEPLVSQDEKMTIQPRLAESWQQLDDLTWEFKLKEGVVFHDGSDFNAEVVKANLERIMDPDVASPRSFLFTMVAEVHVVDDHTVQIIMSYPFAPLLTHLSHSGGQMISLEAIKKDYEGMKNGDDPGAYVTSNPTGTGFFEFDQWKSNEFIRLVKNDDYWGDKVKVDSVLFKVVPEGLTRVAELETGVSHIADVIAPSDMSRIDNLDNAHLNRQLSISLAYIGFNVQKEPFDNVKVRQAISMAIDKEGILQGIYEGTGVPAKSPMAPDVWGFDDSVEALPYDIEKAKALLAEAGYENGFSTTIWTNDNPQRIDIAEFVQANLKELGIDVKIEVMEWGAYLDQTSAGKHDMFILGWSASTGDADYAMSPLFHSENAGEPGNRTFLADPTLDELLEAGREESDEDKRRAIYRDAQERLVELAPMLYIHHQEYLTGVSDKVKGFSMHPTGIYQIQHASIENE